MPEQDRSRWDRYTIEEACTALEHALGAGPAGPFLVEAAIAALHSRAARAEDTDWEQIPTLYTLLEPMRPTAAVRVNRAFAVSQAHGPSVALALLDRDDDLGVNAYPYSHLVRGVLFEQLGRFAEARSELTRAERSTRNAHEARQIRARIHRLENGRT